MNRPSLELMNETFPGVNVADDLPELARSSRLTKRGGGLATSPRIRA